MKITTLSLIIAFSILLFSGCKTEGPIGPPGQNGQNGQNATVYYSEWFSPSAWEGTSGDWYFDASAPDLTQDIVEQGVVLGYVWLGGDLYNGTSVRPLPAFALGANWDFLVHQYGSIEYTSDMVAQPNTSGNKFRFIAIPGTIPALKSASLKSKSAQELRSMTYQEVCKLYNIPE
jgi:hypothetical protein